MFVGFPEDSPSEREGVGQLLVFFGDNRFDFYFIRNSSAALADTALALHSRTQNAAREVGVVWKFLCSKKNHLIFQCKIVKRSAEKRLDFPPIV